MRRLAHTTWFVLRGKAILSSFRSPFSRVLYGGRSRRKGDGSFHSFKRNALPFLRARSPAFTVCPWGRARLSAGDVLRRDNLRQISLRQRRIHLTNDKNSIVTPARQNSVHGPIG